MWFSLVQHIFKFISKGGVIFEFLTTPLVHGVEDIPLGFLILEKIGVDISWIYNLSPLSMLVDFTISILAFFLVMRLIHAAKAVWPFGG